MSSVASKFFSVLLQGNVPLPTAQENAQLVLAATNGLTAHAGGGQANALLLANLINRVTTVATGNDSVKLPAATVGKWLIVENAAAANSMNVFPQSGEAINAGAADAAFAMAANKRALFFCAVAGTWGAILTA